MELSPISMNGPSQIGPIPGSGLETIKPADGKKFSDLLGDLVKRVDGLQKDASASVTDVVAGKVTDVHQVAVKVQEAGVAFDLMLGVRNRLMDAYNELIKMQP